MITLQEVKRQTNLDPKNWSIFLMDFVDDFRYYQNPAALAEPIQPPWFVAGMENLKAIALAESPLRFRLRKIFVLENFLSRV